MTVVNIDGKLHQPNPLNDQIIVSRQEIKSINDYINQQNLVISQLRIEIRQLKRSKLWWWL